MKRQSLEILKHQLARIVALSASAWLAFKLVVAAFSRFIPGEPFYQYTPRLWAQWIISPSELLFVIGLATLEYCVLYFMARRLSQRSLIIWGLLLGPYLAFWFFPFDWWHRIDTLPTRYWPPGLVGAALEVVLLLGILPFLMAALVNVLDLTLRVANAPVR